MKKLVLVLASCFVLCCSTNIKAQNESNGQNYVKIQFVEPIGEYSDYYNAGFGIEYGRMFPLNFDIANGLLKPGLDITFIQSTLNTGKDHTYFKDAANYEYKTKGGFLWDLDVKLGPMVSIDITDGLVGDFSIQYVPTLIFANRKGPVSVNEPMNYQSSSSVVFANRLAINAGIRYQHFMFGLEFLFGEKTFDYGDKIIPYYNGVTPQLTDKEDLGLNTFILNVGFSF